MLKKLNWQAYSGDDRNKSIDEIKRIISASDGCIVNFQMYSDLALSLSIEIEESHIPDLHKALCSILKISDLDPESIRPESKKEWLVFLTVSFRHGTGELKKDIPSVPG